MWRNNTLNSFSCVFNNQKFVTVTRTAAAVAATVMVMAAAEEEASTMI